MRDCAGYSNGWRLMNLVAILGSGKNVCVQSAVSTGRDKGDSLKSLDRKATRASRTVEL
jgi:hypothetical protein